MRFLFLVPLIALLSCNTNHIPPEQVIDLSGSWQFAMDSLGKGEAERWYLRELGERVDLPGTMDLSRKGILNRDTTTLHLNRVYRYEGMAWYRREVLIPESFGGKHLELELERTKPTRIWIDSVFVGGSMILQSPQRFDVSAYLNPGWHTISILVNNDRALTPYGNVHIYSDDTQTNWNGIIGSLKLEARPHTRISRLRVFPHVDARRAEIRLELENPPLGEEVEISLELTELNDGREKPLKNKAVTIAAEKELILEYELGENAGLWDEYRQPLYEITVALSYDGETDRRCTQFGLREFKAEGRQLKINGRPVFLRGKQDAAVFPLSGHTPMEEEEWLRVFSIAKSYGINHYRFHSYCPPEAAFLAADRLGIYLQPELPFWGGLDSDSLALRMREEGKALLDAYANHPSFVLFSHGNEIWSGHDRVEENILALEAYDGRLLYTMGSNNSIGYAPPRACSDFFVGARTPSDGDTTLTHLRLTHAFADSRDGGLLNTRIPSTAVNFDHAVASLDIPVISHEIAQYQVFPDYREIDKYTGVLRARNLEVFRDRLEKAGLGQMDRIFQQASGAWSALCYRAEMEAALRTEDMAGFQLLDLQDFPGQGTALVGILDAFMDSKGVISEESWKESCNDVVILPEFLKYCWTDQEAFEVEVKVSNYSNVDLKGRVDWTIRGEDGSLIAEGQLDSGGIPFGGLTRVGHIDADLAGLQLPQKLELNFRIDGTSYEHNSDIWVYPADEEVNIPSDIRISERLQEVEFSHLEAGGKLLYFPGDEVPEGLSLPGLFPPDFWNYGMFRMISENNGKPVSPGTLGLLMDPDHPALRSFPTDFHSNWQWFTIVKSSRACILDDVGTDFYPIVQVIDNMERNHKLGMIFEFRVGAGKLLVCMARLPRIMEYPEARQLYRSLLEYMGSPDFNPEQEIIPGELLLGSCPQAGADLWDRKQEL